jgi:NAD(P)H-nitrite reductase large subunit
LGIGLKLDKTYHGMVLPGKFKMAVSGCPLGCSESWVRDIGLIGQKEGWAITVGGNVGAQPRIGNELISGLDDADAESAVYKIVDYYRLNAKKGERLGRMIERIGLEPFKKSVE